MGTPDGSRVTVPPPSDATMTGRCLISNEIQVDASEPIPPEHTDPHECPLPEDLNVERDVNFLLNLMGAENEQDLYLESLFSLLDSKRNSPDGSSQPKTPHGNNQQNQNSSNGNNQQKQNSSNGNNQQKQNSSNGNNRKS